jgi:tetratricopeptide (TPR) repeat protein
MVCWGPISGGEVARMEPRVFYCQGADAHVWSDPDDAAKCCNGYERAVRVERDARGHVELTYYWRPTAPVLGIAGGVTPPAADLVPPQSDAPVERLTDDARDAGSTALRHMAYFQALGESEAGTPDWEATSAGLVVLRLVDRWVWRHVRERAPTFREFVTVRRAVARVSPGPIRAALEQLASAIAVFSGARAAPVNDCLMVYAQVLQDSAQWTLAADVYDTVLLNARSASDSRALPVCAVRAGFCLRMMGRLDEAQRVYRLGLEIASDLGDRPNALLARVGIAAVAAQRGALEEAESALDDVIAGAGEGGGGPELMAVRAAALHDRGGIAIARQEYERAVLLLYEAFALYQDMPNRDRALNDLATALGSLGLRRAARDAYFVIHSTSHQRDLRWWAGLNLMRLAVLERNEGEFEHYRRLLRAESLTGPHAAHYALFVGEGHARFGRPDRARRAFSRAAQLADEFGLASVAAGAVAAGGASDVAATPAVARVVSAMRVLARVEA